MSYYYHILIIKVSFHVSSFCQGTFFQGVIFLTVLYSGGFFQVHISENQDTHRHMKVLSVAGFFRTGEAFEIMTLRQTFNLKHIRKRSAGKTFGDFFLDTDKSILNEKYNLWMNKIKAFFRALDNLKNYFSRGPLKQSDYLRKLQYIYIKLIYIHTYIYIYIYIYI